MVKSKYLNLLFKNKIFRKSIMGRTERNKRKATRKRMRRQEAFENHKMQSLYEEARLDDNTWEGVTKKEIVDVAPNKKEDSYFGSWWSYFGW